MSTPPVVAAMMALVASVAIGVHIEPVQGSGIGLAEDLQHEIEAVEDSALTTSTFNSLEHWGSRGEDVNFDFPMTLGKLRMENNGDTHWVTVGGYYSDDKRDSSSLYASAITSSNMAVSFWVPLPEDAGYESFKIQVEKNPTSVGSKTDGWYLAVHESVPDDTKFYGFEHSRRVIAHNDPAKAVSWAWEDDRLVVLDNREVSVTKGWYLCAPPGARRDSTSDYIAVCPIYYAKVSVDW